MSEWKKIAVIAGGVIGAGISQSHIVFGGLYIKNYLNEKKARVLSKE
jgi:3-hydroxyacyl-CoA dehydrogenase